MSTTTHPPSIAAFCARNREIGYVLMFEGRIIRYGVKTIKGKRRGVECMRRVTRTLLSVLARLTPRCLVILEDMSHRTKPGSVNQAIRRVGKKWARTQAYRVSVLSLREAKQRICDDRSVTHRALTEAVVGHYPLLSGLRRDFAIYRPLYWELVILAAALADAVEKPSG